MAARTVEAAATILAKDLTGPAFASASRNAKKFAAQQTALTRQMKAQQAQLVGYGKAIGATLGISAAAAVYKLGRAFQDTTDKLDRWHEVSKQVGMSANNIQVLSIIAKKEGISGEQVEQSLKNVSQAYVTLQRNLRGSKQLTAAFPGLSQQVKNAESVEEAVSIALTAMDKMSEADALKWSKMMFGNEDFSKLKKNMEKWRADIREAKRLGGAITPAMTQAASDYDDAMNDLGTSIQSVVTPVVSELHTAATPMIKEWTEWIVANREWIGSGFKEFFKDISEFAKTTAKEIKFVADQVRAIIEGARIFQRMLKTPVSELLSGNVKPDQIPHPGNGAPGRIGGFTIRRPGDGRYGTPSTGVPGGGPQSSIPGAPGVAPGTPVGGTGGRATALAAGDLPPEARAMLAGISSVEAGKHGYQAINYAAGGGAFKGTRHPFEGKKGTTAAGKYQFLWTTWKNTAAKMGIDPREFTPENQDKAAWFLAQEDYKIKSGGRDLAADMKNPKNFRYITRILGTDRREGKAQWVGLGADPVKAIRAMNRELAAERELSVDPLPNDPTTAAYLKRRKGKPGNQLGGSLASIQGGRQAQVHNIGKGQVDLNIKIAGQPVQVQRLRVQQPDLMTLNTGVDNTGARHYRPGTPLMGPV